MPKADPSVTDALSAFSRPAKTAALLGRSKEFRAAVDRITEAKRAYAPETGAPKKNGRPAKRAADGRAGEKSAGGEMPRGCPKDG